MEEIMTHFFPLEGYGGCERSGPKPLFHTGQNYTSLLLLHMGFLYTSSTAEHSKEVKYRLISSNRARTIRDP